MHDMPAMDRAVEKQVELPADDLLIEQAERQLQNSRAACDLHARELERNRRIARACEAALKELSAREPDAPSY